MKPKDRFRGARRSWLLVVAFVLAGIGVGAVYSLVAPLRYEASSVVLVSARPSAGEVQRLGQLTESMVASYADLVRTPVVTQPVIDGLSLDETPDGLAGDIGATVSSNTSLVTISATASAPADAVALADALAASLVEAVEAIETPDDGSASVVRLTVVEQAAVPSGPVSPNVLWALALGALTGLVVGLGVAILRELFDDRTRTSSDVEHALPAPLLGAIPYDRTAASRPLIAYIDPLSPRAEAFRGLRDEVEALAARAAGSLVPTAGAHGEGTTTTAINLAIALADDGKRVALIDADLHEARVADYMGIQGAHGLVDVMAGRVRVGDVMLPWGSRSLYVMPAGSSSLNPAELLGSHNMRVLLEVLERDFDVVICDAPPLRSATDATILAGATRGVVLVASAGRESGGDLSEAAATLRSAGATVAGVVLTMSPERGDTWSAPRVDGPRRTRQGSPSVAPSALASGGRGAWERSLDA